MELSESYIGMTAIISAFKPYIMDIVKYYWFGRFKDEKLRKSIGILSAMIIGILIAIIANWIGDYNSTKLAIFLVGTGISYPAGQLTYILTKKNGTK